MKNKRKNQRVKTAIEEFLAENEIDGIKYDNIFELLIKNCLGMSRYKAAEFISKATNIRVIPSTLWNIVDEGTTFGDITKEDFEFTGKRGKKIGQVSNLGKHSAPKEIVNKDTKNADSTKTQIAIRYICNLCKHDFTKKMEIESIKAIALRATQCEKCMSFGSCTAEFEINGQPLRKSVVQTNSNPVIIQEAFVDANDKPLRDGEDHLITNPLKEKTNA